MNRLQQLLHNGNEFLLDGETLVYLKDNEVIALHNDGETLTETKGNKLYFWDKEKEVFTEISKVFVDSDGDISLS
jgi:hypothetical protein